MDVLLLVWVIAPLVIVLIEHRKEMKETQLLKYTIAVYDRSEKVIKDCTVYAELPITVNGNNLAFISCHFNDLMKTTAPPALKEILGLEA